jgi:threonine synthase
VRSRLRCIECGAQFSLDEVRYRCDCGELLEVWTDFASFGRSGAEWQGAFESARTAVAFQRYRDLLLPDLPAAHVVTLFEGDTPLYAASGPIGDYVGVDELYLKHEGMNPTLSFKDRGMVAGVSWAKHLGVGRVICASTGDTSASMAAYAARAGIRAAVLLPRGKVSGAQLSQAVAYGAQVVELETDFDGCMRIVQALAERPEVYLLNSMNSIRIEGQKAIGIETLHQLGWNVPDFFVCPVGNAGNISALGKGIRELHEVGVIGRLPRLVGVEPERANPLYVSYRNGYAPLEPVKASDTVASAMRIGSPVSFKKAVRELKESDGLMEQVSEDEILDAKAVADNNGIAVCPNSATALAAVRKLRQQGTIRRQDKVVVILTGHGAKYAEEGTAYYLDPDARFSNRPTVVEADLTAVEKALGL